MDASVEHKIAPRPSWLATLRIYLTFVVLANLLWEVLQLPLYAIWRNGTVRDLIVAVAHCTVGDILIALATLMLALLLVGNAEWPEERYVRVAFVSVALGVGYTVFSEWLNLVARKSWAYSELMPVVPVLGVGLSPLMQWIAIPIVGLRLAIRM